MIIVVVLAVLGLLGALDVLGALFAPPAGLVCLYNHDKMSGAGKLFTGNTNGTGQYITGCYVRAKCLYVLSVFL